MKCQHASDLLSAYLDGELDAEQTSALEAHLQGCARCRSELEQLRRLDQVLLDVPEPTAPEGFSQGVRAAAERRKLVRAGPWRATRLKGALLKTAALMLLAAGLSLGALAGRSSLARTQTDSNSDAATYQIAVDSLSATGDQSLTALYLTVLDQDTTVEDNHVQ